MKTFSLMGQSVNNVGFLRLSGFCTTTQLTMHENHHAQMCELRSSNKTLFIKPGGMSTLARELVFADPWTRWGQLPKWREW